MDFREDLNDMQERAVRHPGGPLLVLAGAGSGKTRVLTFRIAYLVGELGVSPRRILAVTFTNKAADEMRRRVADLVGREAGMAWIGTFHSMCARILRREASWGWWTPAFTIYDEDDQIDLVKESMERVGIAASNFAPKAILSAISRAKDRLKPPAEFVEEATDYFEECVAKVYAEYQKALARNNALDFDDLIMSCVGLLRGSPPVLDAYAGRFEHVLVDEYQDTSHAQYALVHLLSSRHGNVCVVGDDDQSIYGWRGADITNILDFEKDHPDAAVIRLEQNYRSTKSILDAAHDVVSRNVRRKDKKLWTAREKGRPVALARVSNEYEEADAIRDTVLGAMAARGLSYHDFAVLYRTHAQSRVIEDSLRRAGIVYDIVGGVRFYERAEVKDVLAYLKVVVNSADSVSLKRIINTPPRRIGDRTVERLEAHASAHGGTLLDALAAAGSIDGIPSAARRPLSDLALLFGRLVAPAAAGHVASVLGEIVDGTGYRAWLERQKTEEAAARLANVEELLSAASEFAESSDDPSAAAFLEQVSLVSAIDLWEDRANAVSLMTLHNAKGLEFTVVMVPGLEEGLLPHESALDDDEELEEERRLFYVGMTRAKDELHLLTADTRRRAGVLSCAIPSRFLGEIGREHLAVESSPFPVPAMRRSSAVPRRPGARPERAPAYEDYSQDEPELGRGTRVRHATFGDGEIVDISGHGLDAVARIRFEGGLEKRIMLRYAKLEILPN